MPGYYSRKESRRGCGACPQPQRGKEGSNYNVCIGIFFRSFEKLTYFLCVFSIESNLITGKKYPESLLILKEIRVSHRIMVEFQ